MRSFWKFVWIAVALLAGPGGATLSAANLQWRNPSATTLPSHDCVFGFNAETILCFDSSTRQLTLIDPRSGRSETQAASPFSTCIPVAGGGGLLAISAEATRPPIHLTVSPTGSLEQASRPLPAISPDAIACLGERKTLFVCDGVHAGSKRLWSLDLSRSDSTVREWPAWPDASFVPTTLAYQNDGDVDRLWAFGELGNGSAAYILDARSATWRRCASPPMAVTSCTAVASGQGHILLLGKMGGSVYSTITDTWTRSDDLPPAIAAGKLGDELAIVDPSGQIRLGKRPAMASRFGWLDYTVFAAYPVLLLIIGVSLRVRTSDADGYFRGGQRIPWWAAGLSLMATQISAIGFMAIPAKSFATDWAYFGSIATWFVVVPIITRYYIPLFRRLNVTTAYEYLELRFNFAMRAFASVMFIVMQVLRGAIVLFLPALAISAVTGLGKIACVVGLGVVSSVYTLWGGMHTVIWTGVVQAVTLLCGVLLCVVIVLVNVGGVGQFFQTAWGSGKFNLVSSHWDMAGPSLWVVLIGGVFSRLVALTSDQNVVQRYQATSSDREASHALWTDACFSIPWAILIFLMGTSLFVFFKTNPQALDPSMDTDQIVPLFIVQRVPPGLAGLIIAAIFAASLEGSLLSVATTFVNDIYGRLVPSVTPRGRVAWARGVTIVLGGFSTCVAVLLATSSVHSLWDQATRWTGLFSGGFGGVFILALFAPRVGSAAAFIAIFASAITMYFVQSSDQVSVLIYAAFGVVSCVVAGVVASLFLPAKRDASVLLAKRMPTMSAVVHA